MSVRTIHSLLREFLENYVCKVSILQEAYKQRFAEVLDQNDYCCNVEASLLEKFLQRIPSTDTAETEGTISYSERNCKCTFINGVFQWENSYLPEGVVVLPLNKAKDVFSSFFELQEARWRKREKNLFSLLNEITAQKGIFLFLPKCLKGTINLCLKNVVSDSQSVAMPRLHILVGDGICINIDIRQELCSSSKELFFNGFLDVFLGINSVLKMSKMARQLRQCNLFEFWSIRAVLLENASFTSYLFNKEHVVSRICYDMHLLLEGVLSSACVQSGMSLEQEAKAKMKVYMEHLAEKTSSRQNIKAIVNDKSKNDFEGGIFVASEAQKADAYQRFSGLMLADDSLIQVSPQLKILADDVKASHGASVKQLEENLIFYLRTRGISQAYAKLLLTESFFNDLVLNTL